MRAYEGRQGQRLLAVLLIGLGALLLVLRLFDWRISDYFWPFFVVVPGVALFAVSALIPGRESRFTAVAGAVVAGSGLILFLQAVTDYFQSWAYAWTLLPVFAGAALLFVGRRDADPATTATGRGLALWGGVMFVVFAVAFEGLIFNGDLLANGIVLPVVLIAVGVFVLFRGTFVRRDTGGNGGGTGENGAAKGPPAAAQS